MLPEQLRRIIDYFIEEAQDYLSQIELGLLNLSETLGDPETLNRLFRAAHSIKGGAAMLGLNNIRKTARCLEESFRLLRVYPVEVDRKLQSLMLSVFDILRNLVTQLRYVSDVATAINDETLPEIEKVFDELERHLGILVSQIEMMPASLSVIATTATEQIYLTGSCSLQIVGQIVNQFRGNIIRRVFNPEGGLRLEIEILRLSSLQALRSMLQVSGGIVHTVQITDITPIDYGFHYLQERLKPCMGCKYYYGRRDGGHFLVCAIHPNGPESDSCRDWESEAASL
ncbi:MAG: Hpt domain-containing protein [Cyanobacteriota bacterium SKYGB_h_bin112]|nr:Hpt domain-containing protein [Cyanobacteriota bacterium SKYGB_h_bin112]